MNDRPLLQSGDREVNKARDYEADSEAKRFETKTET